MTKSPKVSVIVTTYNRKIELSETINSILAQTFEDFELIIVDNYSNYNFNALINSFNDLRIISFQNKNDGIIAVNRNYGIKKAKGKYLAFCDDDDIWYKTKLEKQINFMKKFNFDLVYTNIELFGSINRVLKYNLINTTSRLLFRNEITLSSVLLKKSKYIKFDSNKNNISFEDFLLWYKLLKLNLKFGMIDEVLVKYRTHSKGYSSNRLGVEAKRIRIYIDFVKSSKSLKNILISLYKILVSITKYIYHLILNLTN